MSDNKLSLKHDNRGLSLVELIIAISIGVIVSGTIAALISFSITMYQNESVNTSMQYELQSNINTIMDEIMSSSVFVVEQNSGADPLAEGEPYTKYALFGNPNADITIGGAAAKGFKGVIFVSSSADSEHKFKVYMQRIEEALPAGGITAIASSHYSTVSGTFATEPNPYLLGENVTQFVIVPDPENKSFVTDLSDPTKNTYKNPIEVKVELKFKDNGWGAKTYEKHVDDITYLRNKATETVYVNSTPYSLKKKEE